METQLRVGKQCTHGCRLWDSETVATGLHPEGQLSKGRVISSLGSFLRVATEYFVLDKSGISIVHFIVTIV